MTPEEVQKFHLHRVDLIAYGRGYRRNCYSYAYIYDNDVTYAYKANLKPDGPVLVDVRLEQNHAVCRGDGNGQYEMLQ